MKGVSGERFSFELNPLMKTCLMDIDEKEYLEMISTSSIGGKYFFQKIFRIFRFILVS